jgi:hypothetical protein
MAQGSPRTRFNRAIEKGSLRLAELAAFELRGRLTLDEALALVCLYAREPSSPRYERAAVRFLARLADEQPGISLSEIQLAAAVLAELPHRPWSADHSRLVRDLLTNDTQSRLGARR